MRKKWLSLLLPVFILISVPTVIFTSCNDDPVTEEEDDEDDDEEDPKNADGRLLTFRINASRNPSLNSDILFTIDENSKTASGIYLYWIDDNENLELTAVFTYRGEEIKVGQTEQLTGTTKNSFLSPVKYTIVDDNNKEVTYEVKLFTPQFHSSIPVVRVDADGPIESKTTYVPAKLQLKGNAEYDTGLWDFSQEKVGIRRRGNSTFGLPKKPYRIKFDSRYRPFGLDANAKSWVLIANDCDKTLLRNAVAFETARKLYEIPNPLIPFHERTIKFVPATVHVDFFLDGKYEGVYHFTDQMQQDKNRINVADASSNLTGGYLLEVDIHNEGEDERDRLQTWIGMRITRKYPAYDDDGYTTAHKAYIEDFMTQAEQAMYGDNFADPDEGWRKYWDAATAVDFFIIKEFSGDPDGFCSIYLYKQKDCDKFFFGPVWDFDSAYDNDNRIGDPRTSLMIYSGFNAQDRPSWMSDSDWNRYNGYHWFRRLWDDNTFKASVRDRWNQMKDVLLDCAIDCIDNDVEKIGHSITANYTRWNIMEQKLATAMPSPSSYNSGITALKNYIRERHAYLDGVFNGI